MANDDNGWGEYRQRVFYQLDTLTKQVELMGEQYHQLHIDVVVLKAKAAIYGAIAAGVVAAVIEVGLYWAKTHVK